MAKKQTTKPVAPQQERPVVAFDLGNAYSNFRVANQSGDWRSVQARVSNANRLAAIPADEAICYDSTWWVFGETCWTHAPDAIAEYPTTNRYRSEYYRRLFAYGLYRAFAEQIGQGVVYPRVISSVPAALYRNKAEVKAVKENLEHQYIIDSTRGCLHVKVEGLTVIPEGAGTFFGPIFSEPQDSRLLVGNWGVLDIGYLTIDWLLFRNGEYVADAARSDERCGISTVSDAVADHVWSLTRVRLDRAEVDGDMLDCSRITVNQHTVDISAVRDEALQILAERALLFAEKSAAGINLTGILLTGGGAPYLSPFFNSPNLPLPTLAQNPRRANVDGAYLFMVDKS